MASKPTNKIKSMMTPQLEAEQANYQEICEDTYFECVEFDIIDNPMQDEDDEIEDMLGLFLRTGEKFVSQFTPDELKTFHQLTGLKKPQIDILIQDDKIDFIYLQTNNGIPAAIRDLFQELIGQDATDVNIKQTGEQILSTLKEIVKSNV